MRTLQRFVFVEQPGAFGAIHLFRIPESLPRHGLIVISEKVGGERLYSIKG